LLQLEFNKLQREDTAIRLSVEGKLRKLLMGGIPWSPALQELRDTIELWAMLVRRKQHSKVSVKRIRRFLRRVPFVKNAFTCSLQEALCCRQQAFQVYLAARKSEAIALRQKFQGTLAEAIALK
jgi:hypothetical protein